MRNIQEALRAVTVGDGYHYDVRGTAVKLNPDVEVEALVEEDAPRPWVTLEVTPEEWTFQPSNLVKLAMPVRVHWFHEADEGDEDLLLMCYRGYSDIERAVTRDITRGGLATDTRITSRVAVAQGRSAWVAVDLLIGLIRTYGEASA